MIGPVQQIAIGGGASAPLYLLRFGKDGKLQSPKTARLALEAAKSASDVFLFSHGWNNIYKDALDRYVRFATGFVKLRDTLGLPIPPKYCPVLIGMIWPATWFVLPWERGPNIAGGVDDGTQDEEMLADLTDTMSDEDAGTLAELLDGSHTLSETEARQIAELVRAQLWSNDDPDGASTPPDTDTVLSSWRAMSEEDTPFVDEDDETGTIDDPTAGTPSSPGEVPTTAGGVEFDPRDILRMGSVWKMKDRAGAVGTHGVGPVLKDVLTQTKAHVHLVGHSFGARVMLSALVSQQDSGRNVHSMLLLQPAVNRWCFATDVAGTGQVAGYQRVLDRVDIPIVTTLSVKDKALHDFFHLAVRGDSLGEIDTAGVGDTDRYGALGGYGPSGLGDLLQKEDAHKAGTAYDLKGPKKMVAVDGSLQLDGKTAIDGHGDISNSVTWWALHSLVAATPHESATP